jgi:uncharacterized protein (TIGR00730 family)
MSRICVFCGSSPGNRSVYLEAAQQLGRSIAQRGWGLVYGGGKVGLMGAVANAALAAQGEVIGVIPYALEQREVAHDGLTQLRVVNTMHERKALMADLSDAFIALPGGYGTLDELSEVVTWTQLGVHRKPCGLLNVDGFFDGLLTFLDEAVQQGFVSTGNRGLLLCDTDANRLLDRILQHHVPSMEIWVDRSQV